MALDWTEKILIHERGLGREFEKSILSVEEMSFEVKQSSEELETD